MIENAEQLSAIERRFTVGLAAVEVTAEPQIVAHRQPRKQPAVLRHMRNAEADDPVRGGRQHVGAFHRDRALGRTDQAGDHAHQRGLSGAVGTDHADRFARVDLEVDTEQRLERAVTRIERPELEHVSDPCPAARFGGRGQRRVGIAAEIDLDHARIGGHRRRQAFRNLLAMVEHHDGVLVVRDRRCEAIEELLPRHQAGNEKLAAFVEMADTLVVEFDIVLPFNCLAGLLLALRCRAGALPVDRHVGVQHAVDGVDAFQAGVDGANHRLKPPGQLVHIDVDPGVIGRAHRAAVSVVGDAKAALEALVDTTSLALYCTPAINLFRKRLDRIQLGPGSWEYHVVPDLQRTTMGKINKRRLRDAWLDGQLDVRADVTADSPTTKGQP